MGDLATFVYYNYYYDSIVSRIICKMLFTFSLEAFVQIS